MPPPSIIAGSIGLVLVLLSLFLPWVESPPLRKALTSEPVRVWLREDPDLAGLMDELALAATEDRHPDAPQLRELDQALSAAGDLTALNQETPRLLRRLDRLRPTGSLLSVVDAGRAALRWSARFDAAVSLPPDSIWKKRLDQLNLAARGALFGPLLLVGAAGLALLVLLVGGPLQRRRLPRWRAGLAGVGAGCATVLGIGALFLPQMATTGPLAAGLGGLALLGAVIQAARGPRLG